MARPHRSQRSLRPRYSDTGLAAGTTYSYTVRAIDAAGNVSSASAAGSATTTGTPPARHDATHRTGHAHRHGDQQHANRSELGCLDGRHRRHWLSNLSQWLDHTARNGHCDQLLRHGPRGIDDLHVHGAGIRRSRKRIKRFGCGQCHDAGDATSGHDAAHRTGHAHRHGDQQHANRSELGCLDGRRRRHWLSNLSQWLDHTTRNGHCDQLLRHGPRGIDDLHVHGAGIRRSRKRIKRFGCGQRQYVSDPNRGHDTAHCAGHAHLHGRHQLANRSGLAAGQWTTLVSAGYRVFRNGSTTPLATTTLTRYSDTGLAAGTTYSYTVRALDAAGNVSNASAAGSATTSGTPPGADTTPPTVPGTPTATADQQHANRSELGCLDGRRRRERLSNLSQWLDHTARNGHCDQLLRHRPGGIDDLYVHGAGIRRGRQRIERLGCGQRHDTGSAVRRPGRSGHPAVEHLVFRMGPADRGQHHFAHAVHEPDLQQRR